MRSNRLWVTLAIAVASNTAARADGPPEGAPPKEPPLKLKWTHGPAPVELGSLADLKLPDGIAFCGPDDARKLLDRMGNIPNNLELGIVRPEAEGQEWFVILRRHDVGYIKDDEKDKIDADAILKSISEGTEEANEVRKKRGIAGVHVDGWKQAPHYEEVTHHFIWSMLAHSDDGEKIVNYNVRLLGREGYVSATLVGDPAGFDSAKLQLDQIMKGFSFKTVHSFAVLRAGDKVAEYGLTALVAAGAGAAAVKLGLFGLLAKFFVKAWKLIILGFAALAAAVQKIFKSLFGSKGTEEVPTQIDPPPPGQV